MRKSQIIDNPSNSLENNKSNDDSIDLDKPDDNDKCEYEVDEKSEIEQIISFNLVIKSSTISFKAEKQEELEHSWKIYKITKNFFQTIRN
ncbi:5029_t:CDS:2 [Funneliformis caledonium]|uniref:5029_t:CDS:1 n=1 Tax=Funneliformis caledonium TaxID=1117310 RepID=A0A9N9HFF4_9GLOM|nr:5029_t:CDS:2 [Funneliformis caledonium]